MRNPRCVFGKTIERQDDLDDSTPCVSCAVFMAAPSIVLNELLHKDRKHFGYGGGEHGAFLTFLVRAYVLLSMIFIVIGCIQILLFGVSLVRAKNKPTDENSGSGDAESDDSDAESDGESDGEADGDSDDESRDGDSDDESDDSEEGISFEPPNVRIYHLSFTLPFLPRLSFAVTTLCMPAAQHFFDFLSRMWDPDVITEGMVVGVKCAKFSKDNRIVVDFSCNDDRKTDHTRKWEFYIIKEKDASGVCSVCWEGDDERDEVLFMFKRREGERDLNLDLNLYKVLGPEDATAKNWVSDKNGLGLSVGADSILRA